jgi:uroporphyrinogen-III synthase
LNRLDGLRIVVTRPASKAAVLVDRLQALGATVIRAPSIDITDIEDDYAPAALLRTLRDYDWVLFTSASGVEAGVRCMERIGVSLSAFDDVRVGAVGPATAAALGRHGITAAAVPMDHVGVNVADVVGRVDGCRFLLVRGDRASPALPSRLRSGGGRVDEAVVYRTISGEAADSPLLRAGFDVVTFTSPSTVESFMTALGDDLDMLAKAAVVTIGPVTSGAARAAGLAIAAEAEPHTVDGLISALLSRAAASRDGAAD